MKLNFETMEATITDGDQQIFVKVPFKSVHAVWTTHGEVEDLMNKWKQMSRQERRRFKRQMAGVKAMLKWWDEDLNETQEQFCDGQIEHHDFQVEFNTEALFHTLWEHFVNGTTPVIMINPTEFLQAA